MTPPLLLESTVHPLRLWHLSRPAPKILPHPQVKLPPEERAGVFADEVIHFALSLKEAEGALQVFSRIQVRVVGIRLDATLTRFVGRRNAGSR